MSILRLDDILHTPATIDEVVEMTRIGCCTLRSLRPLAIYLLSRRVRITQGDIVNRPVGSIPDSPAVPSELHPTVYGSTNEASITHPSHIKSGGVHSTYYVMVYTQVLTRIRMHERQGNLA